MSNNYKNTLQFLKYLKIAFYLFGFFMVFVIIRGGILEKIHQSDMPVKKTSYFERFNHFFKGVVVQIKRREPEKTGRLSKVYYKIRLIESTTTHYMQRKKGKEYFCVIDFPIAEVMSDDFGYAQIGDTCFYNGATDCFGIKIANLQWFTMQPEVGEYKLLNAPYSVIPRYTVAEFNIHKETYPRAESVSPEQINFYYQNECKDIGIEKPAINFGLKFYTYDAWKRRKDLHPLNDIVRKQSVFFMLQLAAYKDPLLIDSLEKKFEGEPIIWIENEGLHKYFINKKFDNINDADTFLQHIIYVHDLAKNDWPIIKKLNKKGTTPTIEKSIKSYLDEEEDAPEVVVIPYPSSYFRHLWIIFIIFTFFNVFSQWYPMRKDLAKNKQLAKGFKEYSFGLLVMLNLWLLAIGIGIEAGWADSVYDFMLNKGKPIVIIANVYLLVFLYVGSRWIYFKEGAETLAKFKKYPGGIFNPIQTPDLIKFIWSILVVLGLVFVFARMFF